MRQLTPRSAICNVALTLVALFGPACSAGEADVWLGFPPAVRDGETLVIVYGESVTREVAVIDPASGPTDVVIRSPAGQTDPFALVLSGRAQDAGLALGRHPVVRSTEGRRLFGDGSAFFPDAPHTVYGVMRRRDPPSAVWVRVRSLPSELSALAVPFVAQACPRFGSPAWVEVLTGFNVIILETLDDRHALLVSRDIAARADVRWVASRAGLVEVGSGERVTDIERVGRTLWMADALGRVWQATVDAARGWRARERADVPSVDVAIVGLTTSGTTADIFVGTAAGDVRHYDGRRWMVLGPTTIQPRRLVSTGAGEAFLVDDRGRLVRATPNGLSEVPSAPPSLYSVQIIDGYGPVVGDESGAYFARQAGDWVPVVPGDFGWFGLSATGYRDGVVYLLASGLGGFYSAPTRFCDEEFGAGTLVTDGRVLTVGDDLTAAFDAPDASEIRILWMTPR